MIWSFDATRLLVLARSTWATVPHISWWWAAATLNRSLTNSASTLVDISATTLHLYLYFCWHPLGYSLVIVFLGPWVVFVGPCLLSGLPAAWCDPAVSCSPSCGCVFLRSSAPVRTTAATGSSSTPVALIDYSIPVPSVSSAPGPVALWASSSLLLSAIVCWCILRSAWVLSPCAG